MNCALRKRALVAGVVLVVALVSGLVIRGSARSDQQPPDLPGSDKHPAETAVDRPGTPASDRSAILAEGSVETSAAISEHRPENTDDRRRLLETVGSLTMAHCYQAYVNIGLLADARARGVYDQKAAARLLDSVLTLLDSVDRNLAALDNLELDKQDRSSLDQMRVITTLLHQQGQELQGFWTTGTDENAARYEDVRKDCWAAISRLRGSRQ
jgi:hypothetical protein